MTSNNTVLDLQRTRWRRAREPLRLLDPEADDFATGGLARVIVEASTRLLILPADPEAALVEFDEDFWTWWLEDRTDPATGRRTSWGSRNRPTSRAAVRFSSYREEGWESYLALLRSGALDIELGSDATYQWEGRRAFRLTLIVGRIWAALALYGKAVERFGIVGPWEVSLALRDAEGAVLGNVATGWAEPGHGFYDTSVCLEPGVLLRQEIVDWPTTDGIQYLAFTIGGWIEDSFGSSQRRFLASSGDLSGQFDRTQYRW